MLNNPKMNPGLRSAFTLVELLIVITIIAVLSGLSLGVLASAQNDARAQIESLLAVQLEDYEVRRLPISNRELVDYVRANTAAGDTTPVLVRVRALRRQILMDIINSEIPRPRFNTTTSEFEVNSDVGNFPSTVPGADITGAADFTTWLNDNYGAPLSASGPTLAARLAGLETAGVQSLAPLNDPFFDLPGEYLYAVLERMNIDGSSGIELLGNQAIDDVDGDTFPEVVDAWGEPLQLRIWQIATVEPAPVGGSTSPVVYTDVAAIDFDDLETGSPKGYTLLNPSIPREIRKIRFQVVSTRVLRDAGDTSAAVQDVR